MTIQEKAIIIKIIEKRINLLKCRIAENETNIQINRLALTNERVYSLRDIYQHVIANLQNDISTCNQIILMLQDDLQQIKSIID